MSTVSAKGDGEVPDPRVEQSNNELVIRISGPGSCVSQRTSEELTETEVREQSITKGTVSKVISPALAFSSNELGAESGVERKRGGTSSSVEVATVPANGDGEVPDPKVEQSNNELVIRGTER